MLTEFSEKDWKQVDREYEQTYWPGGQQLESVAPVPVSSGVWIGVGDITPKLVPLYRARVSVDCEPGSKAELSGLQLRAEVPCGRSFLITGLEPGTHLLKAASGNAESRVRGVTDLNVKDENIAAKLALARGADVDVRAVTAEGAAKPELKTISLSLLPIDGADLQGTTGALDTEGKRRFRNVEFVSHRIVIAGLGAGYCVKELRYNGALIPDNVLRLSAGALSHMLDIVVDDKPAMLAGKVDGKVRPHLVMGKWPIVGDVHNTKRTATADEDGKFRITGLSPGEYRVVAVPLEFRDLLEAPGVLERLLQHSGKKVTLSSGGFQEIALEISDLRR